MKEDDHERTVSGYVDACNRADVDAPRALLTADAPFYGVLGGPLDRQTGLPPT